MKLEKFNNLKIKKGANYVIEYETEPSATRKAFAGRVKKCTTMVGRFGVKYANMKANEGKETGPMIWGEFKDDNNFIIEYNGKLYLRVTTSSLPNVKPKTIYLLDGEEITKENLIEMGALGNRKPTETPLVMNIKLENIINIRCGD